MATTTLPHAKGAQRVPMRLVMAGGIRPVTAVFNGTPVPSRDILAQAGISVRSGMGLRIGGYALDLDADVRPALREHVALFASAGGQPGGAATLDGPEESAFDGEVLVTSPLTAVVSENITAG